MRPRAPAGLVLVLRLCLNHFFITQNLKRKAEHSPNRPKRLPRPWQLQLRTPHRLDSQSTDSRNFVNNMRLMPVNTASIAAAKPVAHGAVCHRIECCCYIQESSVVTGDNVVCTSPVLCREQISRFRIPAPCSSRVRWASRVGTLPFFQGWASPLPQLDGASLLGLHLGRRLVFVYDFIFCCRA